MFGPRYFGPRYYGPRYFGKFGLTPTLVCDDISRAIGADTDTEIAIDFTRPVFLVKMEFDTATQYVSSGPLISFESNTYVEGQVHVGTFTWDGDGNQSGKVKIYNENNSAASLMLNEGVNDIPITIYLTYMIAGGGGNTTPELLVAGTMNGGSLNAKELIISVLSTKVAGQFLPNRYYTIAEGFNHMPIDGSSIMWGGEKFILEAKDS